MSVQLNGYTLTCDTLGCNETQWFVTLKQLENQWGRLALKGWTSDDINGGHHYCQRCTKARKAKGGK